MEKKKRGKYELKGGRCNNNKQYTPSKTSDSKEEAASREDWALAWPKREKRYKKKPLGRKDKEDKRIGNNKGWDKVYLLV